MIIVTTIPINPPLFSTAQLAARGLRRLAHFPGAAPRRQGAAPKRQAAAPRAAEVGRKNMGKTWGKAWENDGFRGKTMGKMLVSLW